MRLMETIAVTENDICTASLEMADLRAACSSKDLENLNIRKEIEFHEKLVGEQKEIAHQNYGELTRLRDVSYQLDKELDSMRKRFSILKSEMENNEHRVE